MRLHKLRKSLEPKIPAVILFIAIALFSFYEGYYLGEKKNSAAEKQTTTSISTPELKNNPDQNLNTDFSLFWDAVHVAKEKYVNIDEISDKDFLYGAIKGAISALKDPYSVFLEPTDAKKFEEDIKGVFGGIGAEIGIREDKLVVLHPLKGNPAELAGLKPKDEILKIDDTITAGLSSEDAVKLIRGEVGTKVKFLIFREGWDKAKDFTITRAVISVPTLDWKMVKSEDGAKNDIFYIQLYTFNSTAASLFRQAGTEALFKGTRGVILDLRGNGGGYLDVAVDLSGWFIDRGKTVVQERFRNGKTDKMLTHGNTVFSKMPVVVLVDEGSASASEILAGALRDQVGAKIIGAKTFGKGSVQELSYLKDGSTLKISTAEWLTPKGHSINKKGIEPDAHADRTLACRDPQKVGG